MVGSLNLLGVPSSAGAYAPGQELAPSALRNAGLVKELETRGFSVNDLGDLPTARWQVDKDHPDAMNAGLVVKTALSTARQVQNANSRSFTLVIGGDCTIEVGVVAGFASRDARTGLIYMDLDCDLNTPKSTTDGALDWMGVTHLLDLEDCVSALAGIGARRPLMTGADICLFGCRNITPFEQQVIADQGLKMISFSTVTGDPKSAAGEAIAWCRSLNRVLVHFDADIIDFADFPIAENTRRQCGMTFDIAMNALQGILRAPNIAACTVTEINPLHCDAEQTLVRRFAVRLADAIVDLQMEVGA
jgi:arginase